MSELIINVFRFNRMVYRGSVTGYYFANRVFEKRRCGLVERKFKHRSIDVLIKKLNSQFRLRNDR